MDFERPTLQERFSQFGYLLKHTFTIVGRDRDILTPIIAMGLYGAFVVALFVGGISAIIVGMGRTAAWMLLAAVVAFVYKFFFYNRQELRLSRLVYDTACGRDATLKNARAELAEMQGSVRTLALIDMAGAWIAAQRGNGGFVMRLILGALLEIWDLVNHFLLPVFAIDKVGFKEGGERLHKLRDHVPETLAGVFGIDIMGGVVGAILSPIYPIAFLLGIASGLAFGGVLPAAFSAGPLGDLFPTIPDWLPVDVNTLFNWLPLFVLGFLAFALNSVLARLVTSIKVIYFTLFYTRIAHADALAPDIRNELEGYLNLKRNDDTPAEEPSPNEPAPGHS